MIWLIFERRGNVKKIRAATMYKQVAERWRSAVEAHLFAEGKTAWSVEVLEVEDGALID